MTSELHVEICSPPDREGLVAAAMLGNEQIAEVDQESGENRLEIYPRTSGEPWKLDLHAFVSALSEASSRLAQLG